MLDTKIDLRDIGKFFREAHRVLRPGGMLLTMELPPPIRPCRLTSSSTWTGTATTTSSPSIARTANHSPTELVAAAGFRSEHYFQFVIPQFSHMPEAEFAAAVRGERSVSESTGRLSTGVQWFGYGAWRRA